MKPAMSGFTTLKILGMSCCVPRVAALALHHAIEPAELEGRLFLDSGRDRPLIIAEVSDGVTVAMPVVDDLISELKRRNIRLLIVDPFVKSHRLEENRNEQIDFATSLWSKVADAADCAVLLLHHFRKGGGVSGEAASFRGASAMIDAARAAVSLGDDERGRGHQDRRYRGRAPAADPL